MRWFVRKTLSRAGYDAVAVGDGDSAVAEFEARRADVAVVDLKMPGLDGLGVISELRRRDPEVIVIVMTAYGTVNTAVEAMKRGAHDYITKPFEGDELLLIVDRALEHRATLRENRDLRRMIDHRSSHAGLIGQSPAMRAVFSAIDLVQGSDATVLITGESGTGKELVARAIHMGSRRRTGPFVPLHCSALRDSLVDSELFGHLPGAFTDAKKGKQGLLARAHGGTLFLDEVAEISLQTQSKLERFLQEREFVPLGGTETVRVDARIVAATNTDLARAVEGGAFRRELFFRLNVVPIDLPPLRKWREDIPALASHFLEKFARAGKTAPKSLTVDALGTLANYDWPGNIRELENTLERLVVLKSNETVLAAKDLPEEIRSRSSPRAAPATPASYHDAVVAAERAYLKDLLRRTRGNVTDAARLSGLSRGHLHRKIGQLVLDPAAFRGD